MGADAPRLFTIAPDRPFLEDLARAVLAGFPCADPKPPGPFDLGGWTILLPTRRAVREIEDIFFRLKGSSGVLLPRIRPIGDIDEDLLAPGQGADDLGTPVTAPGQLLLLMDLIDEWARAHPATRLAQEIASAPQQVGGLASVAGRVPRCHRNRGHRPGQTAGALWPRIRPPPRDHSGVPGHRAGEISPAPDDRRRSAPRRGAPPSCGARRNASNSPARSFPSSRQAPPVRFPPPVRF
jgi:hypothetical protein